MGANDGVKRGDRADTGDLEAQPKDGVATIGSGVRVSGAEARGDQKPDPADVDADEPDSQGNVDVLADDPDLHGPESPDQVP